MKRTLLSILILSTIGTSNTLTIVVDVFSGRPNPIIQITLDDKEIELFSLFSQSDCISSKADVSLAMRPDQSQSAASGYLGMDFFIDSKDSSLPDSGRVEKGILFFHQSVVPQSCFEYIDSDKQTLFLNDINRKVEKQLFSFIENNSLLQEKVLTHLKNTIFYSGER